MTYDPNAPLIRAKSNYAKDKYKCETLFQTTKYIGYKNDTERLRSIIGSLKRDDELVSFVGEVIPTPIKENKKGEKENGI